MFLCCQTSCAPSKSANAWKVDAKGDLDEDEGEEAAELGAEGGGGGQLGGQQGGGEEEDRGEEKTLTMMMMAMEMKVAGHKGHSPKKKNGKKRGHCPHGAGGGQPQFLF